MNNSTKLELEVLNLEEKKDVVDEQVIQPRNEVRRNVITIFIISLSALAFGLGLNSGIVEYQVSRQMSLDMDIGVFTSIYGISMALLLAGGALGHVIYNILVSKKFTKKKFLLIGATMNFISFASIYWYPHVYFIGAARFIMGINAGFSGAIVPGLIYELAPKKARGFFVAFYPAFIGLGLLIGQALSYFSSADMFFIPHLILCSIFGIQTLLLFLIRLDDKLINEDNKSLLETIRSKECRKSLIFSIIFHVAQHLSGIDFLGLFSSDILKQTSHPYIFGIVNFAIGFIFTCLSGWLCDLGGRKIFFVVSCLTTAVSIGCMNILDYQYIALGVFFLTYNLGLGNIPWVVLGEVLPNPYAKAGTFIAVMSNWSAAFLVTVLSKLIFDFFGNMVYYFFSIALVVTAFITIFGFKETRNQMVPTLQ